MSNFECPHCGMVNIDCGRDNYKTSREIELEQKLKVILDICKNNKCIDNNGYCPQIRNIQEIIEE